MKKGLFVMGLVCLSVMAMLQVGCASAPPTAFEIAESLEGTAWVQGGTKQAGSIQGHRGGMLVMKDKTSGVLIDRDNDDKETAFTYTAVFDEQKRSFAGTITLEDGRVAEFSAEKFASVGWLLTARVLGSLSFQYRTPEELEKEKVYSLSLGQPRAVGSWTAYIPELSMTGTYIINANGSYSVTMSNENNNFPNRETGSWVEGVGGGQIIFTRSDTGQKYTGEIAVNKMIIGMGNDRITYTKQ